MKRIFYRRVFKGFKVPLGLINIGPGTLQGIGHSIVSFDTAKDKIEVLGILLFRRENPADTGLFVFLPLPEHMDQREGDLSFLQVLPNLFAEFPFLCLIIEGIITQLKGDPHGLAEGNHPLPDGRLRLG